MTGLKALAMFGMLSICGLLSMAGPEIVAQAPAADANTSQSQSIESIGERIIAKAITALGPLAILGWFLWHTSTKTLPTKDAQSAEERTAYLEAMAAERAAHKDIVDKIVDELKQERNAVLQVIKSCEARRGG